MTDDLDLIDDPYRHCEVCDQTQHEDFGTSCPRCDIWVCTPCWQDSHPCGRLSVREWFRIQRGALHASNPDLFWGVWKIADDVHLIHNAHEGLWVSVTPYLAIILDLETYGSRQRAFEAVKADMEAAMRRILHASQVTE